MKITSLRIRSVDPVVYGEDLEFEFQLTYDGPLHAASQKNTRSREKHLIRKRLHSQLEKVWKRLHPATPRSPVLDNFSSTYGTTTEGVNKLLEPIERERFRFMPIVRSAEQRVCELDILFMRREEPGYVIVRNTSGEDTGGDLDNRIKTLFDALQVPDKNQAALLTPAPDEDPFYCLLEDDVLVTALSITTVRNLENPKTPEEEKHVRLVIDVKIKSRGFKAADIPEIF